jgi:hypothetical protein
MEDSTEVHDTGGSADVHPVAAQQNIHEFFENILPDRGIYFIATPYRRGKGFEHFACKTIAEMVEKALELDTENRDTYFACASYAKESYVDSNGKRRQRTRENAGWAKCFWIDIDCGEDKAAAAAGYASRDEAIKALMAFSKATGLPEPSVISSGGGFHCYWPLTSAVEKHEWIRKLPLPVDSNNWIFLAGYFAGGPDEEVTVYRIADRRDSKRRRSGGYGGTDHP